MISLESLGFDSYFSARAEAEPDLVPARVSADGQGEFWLLGTQARLASMAGKLRGRRERPVVGDWVLVRDGERAVIHQVLERRTVLTRKAAGREERVQIIAANVDVFFVVTSANDELNLRRLERYLAVVWDSGAAPVIVINKIDLASDAEELVRTVRATARDVPVVTTSATGDAGANALRAYFPAGKTAALIGSSGVGKSSLVNRLSGRAVQTTSDLIDGERGRHTTTRRELFVLPDGGILIDTPGMRELGLIDADAGLDVAFDDIAALSVQCRFSDCKHEGDLGCAIAAAIQSGELDAERYASYTVLQRELASLESRSDPRVVAQAKRSSKQMQRAGRPKSKPAPK